MIDALARDVRYSVRTLRRGAGATAITILTLSLGIGAITASFAVLDAVLLQPIVFDQDRVVEVAMRDPERGNFPIPLTLHQFAEWRSRSHSFSALTAVDHAATGTTSIAIGDRTSPVRLAPVSADFFRVVYSGAPLAGRWLIAADEMNGAELVAVVSYRFWQRAAGGDPAFVGRRLTLGGDRTVVVVGIAPADVDYPLGTDLWAPGATVFDGRSGRFDARNRTFAQFELLGRLAPGVSRDQAHAELSVIQRRVATDFPTDYRPLPVTVDPLIDAVVGNSRLVLMALFAAAALVFVIAGVNVAALLLMRASSRDEEMTVRVALGAGRIELLRQTLTEGLTIGILGTVGGALVARALLAGVQWLAPGDMPRIDRATIDLRVLAFCIVSALVWVLALGTVPAWMHRRTRGGFRLEHSSRTIRGTRGLAFFTAAEIAAAVVVAIGAGLLVRSFAHLQAIDRGFDSANLTVVSLLLPETRHRDARAMVAFYDQLLPQVQAIPGVIAATPIHIGPGTGTRGLSAPMRFEGQTDDDARSNPWSIWEPVLPSYFRTLGIPIVGGRSFTDADRRDRVPVAIVSESVAQRYWPGQSPIGKQLQFVATPDWPWVTVVGVAGDTRYRELTKSWLTVYFPADQFFYFEAASLVVRATTAPDALLPAILQRVRALEPAATIDSIAPMRALLDREVARPFSALMVIGFFALMAIALAAIGVYGVLSNEVRQRRRELAVRCAIGAGPADMFREVFTRSALVGVTGAAIGLAVAASGMQSLRSMLYGVQPLDPIVFVVAAGGLLSVVLLATYFPARIAARTDPVAVLRSE